MMATDPNAQGGPLVDWVDGNGYYRGLPVVRHIVTFGGNQIEIFGVRDAADLLDLPDCAERFTKEDVAPYGMELWPAALMLVDYLAELGPEPCGQAIELGCGLGLVSIAAAMRGWSVTATDNEPTSLAFSELNGKHNGVTLRSIRALDWHRPPPGGELYDLILAADVLYQLVDQAPLLKCVDAVLKPDGVALIADPKRSIADRFPALAADEGFIVEANQRSVQLPDRDKRVHGRIFRLQRPGATGR